MLSHSDQPNPGQLPVQRQQDGDYDAYDSYHLQPQSADRRPLLHSGTNGLITYGRSPQTSLTSNSGVSISCQRQSISTLAASAFSASRPLRARKAAVSKHPRRYTVHATVHATAQEEHKAGGPVRRATCQLPP